MSGWQRQELALSEGEWAAGFADGRWAQTGGKPPLAAATQVLRACFQKSGAPRGGPEFE